FLKKKLPLKDVRIVPYSGDIGKWLIDPKFAQQGYVFSEPLLAERQGGDPHVLMVSELGYDPYGSVLVARRSDCDSHPERVRAFVSAVRPGWQRYLNDAALTNQTLYQLNPTMQVDVLTKSAAAIAPLCLAGLHGPDDIGQMTRERWSSLEQQLLEL